MSNETNQTEYVQKFSYRKYKGNFEPRWKRIWNIALFEAKSSWNRSTVGKVLLVILITLNAFVGIILILSGGSLFPDQSQKLQIFSYVADYFSFIGGDGSIAPKELLNVTDGSIGGLGILVIGLIGIAGSGFFADDKAGNLVEVYLSRVTREEYTLGKIFGMIMYSNIFITLPMLGISVLYAQGFGIDHISFFSNYLLILADGIIMSTLLSLAILILSTLVDKRSYASLIFLLSFILGSIFGVISSISSTGEINEFLLLVAPSNFIVLLSYSILGVYDLTVFNQDLLLNNGSGLEYWHVLLSAFAIVLLLSAFLIYKIHKLTSEDL